VVGLCVWLQLIETTLIGNVPSAGKFAPGASAGALAGAIQTQSATNLLTPAVGALLLVAYAAVLASDAGPTGKPSTPRKSGALLAPLEEITRPPLRSTASSRKAWCPRRWMRS